MTEYASRQAQPPDKLAKNSFHPSKQYNLRKNMIIEWKETFQFFNHQ